MDARDLLASSPHVDEYIVLSTDCDFTPLLRRVRDGGRCSTLGAFGNISPAYRACADVLLDREDFFQHLTPGEKNQMLPGNPMIAGNNRDAPIVCASASDPELSDKELALVAAVTSLLREFVSSSNGPALLPRAAQALTARFGPSAKQLWDRFGGFAHFVRRLPDPNLHVNPTNGGSLHYVAPSSNVAVGA